MVLNAIYNTRSPTVVLSSLELFLCLRYPAFDNKPFAVVELIENEQQDRIKMLDWNKATETPARKKYNNLFDS